MPLPPFVAPPAWTLATFLAIVFVIVLALILAFRATARPDRRRRDTTMAVVVLAVWLAITAVVPASGVLAHDVMPPPPMIFFVCCNGGALALAFSRIGARLRVLPAAALVGFHAFRLPLEIVLERWAEAGTIPIQMSWRGDNLDVITGVAAIAVALVLWRRRIRALELAFHALGLALLVRVATIAVLSSPVPFNTYGGQVLQLGYHAPYAWIVSICVAGALFAHVVGARAALGRLDSRWSARDGATDPS